MEARAEGREAADARGLGGGERGKGARERAAEERRLRGEGGEEERRCEQVVALARCEEEEIGKRGRE